MKKLLSFVLVLGVIALVYTYRQDITKYIIENFIYNREIVIVPANDYERNTSVSFVQITEDFYPKSKQDLLNIFYTVLNKGWDSFVFHCHESYDNCLTDVSTLAQNSFELSHLNNFIHPYNTYEHIAINYNNLGKIEIIIKKLYSDEDISAIDQKINEIFPTIIQETMTTREKINAAHNYIIDITRYDEQRALAISNKQTNVLFDYKSNMAYGPMIQNMAICSGYSDAMALFLDKIGIPHIKVANDNHIWNLVYLDGQWLHLDLTWDDPIVNTKEDILLHTYFLITTAELEKIADGEHTYDKSVYIEAK